MCIVFTSDPPSVHTVHKLTCGWQDRYKKNAQSTSTHPHFRPTHKSSVRSVCVQQTKMSDNRTIKNVNDEMASHLYSPMADKGSLQASVALLGLYETQQPMMSRNNRVSLTPNKEPTVGDEEPLTDIGQAHQASVSEDVSEGDTGTVEGTSTEENPDGQSVRSDGESSDCLPIGWMTSTLKDMEDEHAKQIKGLNKQIDSLKKKNERLQESIGAFKSEVKSLKKNNAQLIKENTKLTSSDVSTIERYKSM